jgi:hypothetical protein
MRSTTETLIAATRELAATIQCEDGVANAALSEVADRLAELQADRAALIDALQELTDYSERITSRGYRQRSERAFVTADKLLERLEART